MLPRRRGSLDSLEPASMLLFNTFFIFFSGIKGVRPSALPNHSGQELNCSILDNGVEKPDSVIKFSKNDNKNMITKK
jgi:hypothetical protein